MVVDRSKYNYGATKVLDAKGNVRVMNSNGDAIAQVMAHADTPEKLAAIVMDNKLAGKVEQGPSVFVNNGQYRMTLGNQLRAKVKRGEPVTVAGITVKKLDQRVPVAPTIKAAEEKARERAKEQDRKAKEAAKTAANKVEKPAKKAAAKASPTEKAEPKPKAKAKPKAAKSGSKSRGKNASTETAAGSIATD